MAILKQGSKGSDVKNIQALLNKAGAKPKLKVDGIFEALTEAAVKVFQKKCKLKADGRIGPKTMPVLEYGKALPTMTVYDYTDRIAFGKKAREHNKLIAECYSEMEKAMAKLARVAAREAPKAKALIAANQEIWDKLLDMEREVVAKQVEFEKQLKTAPQKAEKLVRECEALVKKIDAYVHANMTPNQIAAIKSFRKVREQMEATRDTYKAQLKEIQKNHKKNLAVFKK